MTSGALGLLTGLLLACSSSSTGSDPVAPAPTGSVAPAPSAPASPTTPTTPKAPPVYDVLAELATGDGRVVAAAQDTDFLYLLVAPSVFGGSGALRSIAKTDGTIKDLVSVRTPYGGSLVLDGSDLFFGAAQEGGGSSVVPLIMKYSLAGAKLTALTHGQNELFDLTGLLVEGANVFFTTPRTIKQVARTGGTYTDVRTIDGPYLGVALDSTSVYGFGMKGIFHGARTGTQALTPFSGAALGAVEPRVPGQIVVGGDAVMVRSSSRDFGEERLFHCPKSGTTCTRLYNGSYLFGLATHDGLTYVSSIEKGLVAFDANAKIVVEIPDARREGSVILVDDTSLVQIASISNGDTTKFYVDRAVRKGH